MSFGVMLRQMTAGFGQTCLIFVMTLIFSLPLGLLVYFGRVSRNKLISWIVKIYISVMRGTPLMLQLLVWYFAPYYLWQMNIGGYKLTAILLGCSLNYAAYFAEIYRSGNLLTIIVQLFFKQFHSPCNCIIENIVKYTSDKKRNNRCLCCCNLFCYRKHFNVR